MSVTIGVLNVSDRASAGVYEDTPGQACVALLREWLTTPFEVAYKIVPDEQSELESAMKHMADDDGCCLNRDDWRYRPCVARRDTRSHRRSVLENAPRLRRANA